MDKSNIPRVDDRRKQTTKSDFHTSISRHIKKQTHHVQYWVVLIETLSLPLSKYIYIYIFIDKLAKVIRIPHTHTHTHTQPCWRVTERCVYEMRDS